MYAFDSRKKMFVLASALKSNLSNAKKTVSVFGIVADFCDKGACTISPEIA